jgi:hypothetical protein
MQGEKVTQVLARGIGRVVHGKGYDRIVAGPGGASRAGLLSVERTIARPDH